MLQRAASNAYSWWWASHIRTKQGKWLEQSLQDMEEKVKNILKIIEEDADSFAKRAEMYYRQRPELISFVEDSYKAYRALAERYEHISGELQNANKTIATIFPDQVPLDLDDDEESSPMVPTIDPRKVPKAPENPKFKISIKDMKSSLRSNQKKTQANTKTSGSPRISNEEAQKGIHKLQKGILVLQTEKEYVKSSYESGFARYWEIEKEIEDMQEKICSLQDEAGADMVIDDNDARALMTASALKSCEDTLLQLQEQQNRSEEEAQIESKRVKDAEERLKVFKKRYLQQHVDDQKTPHEANTGESSSKKLMEEICTLKQERLELQSLCEKVKEYFEMNLNSSLAVMDLAEKIDELVNEVQSLGSTIVSQTSLIKELRLETNEFQKNLQSLEEDKMSTIEDSKNLSERVKELEEELHDIQDLDRSVEDQRNKFQTNFTETCRVFDNISETLRSPKGEEGVEITGLSTAEEDATNLEDMRVEDKIQGIQDLHLCDNNKDQENHPQTETCREPDVFYEILTDSQQEKARDKNSFDVENTVLNTDAEAKNEEQTDSPNWQQLFLDGLQDREKALLTEYTTILRNYKETKKKLCEVEKDNQDSLLKIMTQIEELKSSNVSKDEEIQSLRQKLNILETSSDENMNSSSKKSGRSTYAVDHWKFLFSEFQKTRPNRRLLVDLLKERNIDFATRARESSVLASMKSSLKEGDINIFLNNQQHASSNIEETFRRDIDELLEENLKFWLRFSISFNQIQKFHKEAEDLQEEFSNMNKDSKKQEGSHKDSKKQEGSHKDRKKQEGSHKDSKKQEGSSHKDSKKQEGSSHKDSKKQEGSSHKDSKKQEGSSHKDSKKQEGSSHKDSKKQEGSSHKDNRKQEGGNKDSKKQDGSNHSSQHVVTFEAISIEKNLRDLQAELSTWLEQNALLKEELECRFDSLCSIQEEISRISKLESETGGEKITAQQTAKFQGEVLNMQQENNKVAEELQAGLDHVRGLQFEIEKTLSKLNESFDMSGSKNHGHQQNHMMHSTSRGRGVPLRSFLFGAKPKKQSIFSCVNPTIQKHFNEMRAAGRAFPL